MIELAALIGVVIQTGCAVAGVVLVVRSQRDPQPKRRRTR